MYLSKVVLVLLFLALVLGVFGPLLLPSSFGVRPAIQITTNPQHVTLSDLEVLQRQMDSMRGIVHELLTRDVTPVNITAKSVTIFANGNTMSMQVEEVKEGSGATTMPVPMKKGGGK